MGVGHNKESHKKTRKEQNANADIYHHPVEKEAQIIKVMANCSVPCPTKVLEVFAGKGNLTKVYKDNFGANVLAMKKENTGNSFDYIYQLRANKKKFDWIDIDSYGYPDKFFPVVFELMKPQCTLVFTFPIVGVNCLNGITEQHFYTFYRGIPTIGDVVAKITDWGLREWILSSLVDVEKIKRIYRFIFKCKRIKATELCNVRNR